MSFFLVASNAAMVFMGGTERDKCRFAMVTNRKWEQIEDALR